MTPSDDSLRLAEALIFASATAVSGQVLKSLLPEEDAAAVMAALKERYAGRGVELVEVAGGWQFRTAPDLAPRLTRVIEVPRRLPRVAMETLAIIAYRQPVTRGEIEEVRGTALSQNTLDALLEAELIAPRGRKESPGRPTLWGTTPAFLTKFGLQSLSDLPRREDLINDASILGGSPTLPPADQAPAEAGTESETESEAEEGTESETEIEGEGQGAQSEEEAQDSPAAEAPPPSSPET